jgi:hypothetical protein
MAFLRPFSLLLLLAFLPDAPPPAPRVTPPPPAPRPAPRRVEWTWALADSLARKITDIEKRLQRVRAVRVSEAELNSYLNLMPTNALPRGVTDVKVQIQRDGVFARGMVDLDRVKGKVHSTGMFDPLSLLGGLVPVEVRGRLQTKDGYGTVEVEEVTVASIPVPSTMLQQMVATSTKSSRYPEGVDIQAPFKLPYAVKRVRFEPPEAVLEF